MTGMSSIDAALYTLSVLFVVTNFQGVGKENQMFKVDVNRVIVKTVNWSAWAALGTLMLLFTNALVGSFVTGVLLGGAVGLYLVGCMVIAITAWINDNPFKGKLFTPEKDSQSHPDKQVVVKQINA